MRARNEDASIAPILEAISDKLVALALAVVFLKELFQPLHLIRREHASLQP